jgi:UTP--glucose-1-phosphate uridylyltransferase
MIPVVDKPGIQYILEEAVRAGLDDILIVASRGKSVVEDHFDKSLELERHLEDVGKTAELEIVRAIPELATIHYIRQKQPLGFGHAVSLARTHVGDEPFAVMVGDEIVPEPIDGEEPFLPRMIEAFEKTSASVVAVVEVPQEEVPSYGVIGPGQRVSEDVVQIQTMVEKPAVDEAPSNLAARGHYIFTPDIFDAIDRVSAGVGGEIQLTDAINLLAREKEVYAYIHDGPIYDVGRKLDYLKATIQLALRREDLAGPLRSFLEEITAR